MKMRLEIERGPNDVRTLTVEGNEQDIAHALRSLAVEWDVHIRKAQDTDLQEMLMRDPQARALQVRMVEELEGKYGSEIMDRLDRRMNMAVENSAEEFASLVMSGDKTEADLVPFVMARLRAEFLSEIPDFPEQLLDGAIEVSGRMLQEYFDNAESAVKQARKTPPND